MLAFALRRLFVLCLTLMLVSFLAFIIPYVSEGDPVRAIIRARVAELAIDPAAIESMRRHLGLDRPLSVQYLTWLANALQGDLGLSFTGREPVTELVLRALRVSVVLASSALLLALAVALPLGIVAALRPGKAVDNVATLLTQCCIAIPEYWFAPVCILVFALYLGWLPSAGWRDASTMIMPTLVLALRPLAYFTRVTRASMVDVMQAPYITAARSKGLSLTSTVLRHGIRNGMLPVVTLFALWFAGTIGGSVAVEVIFAIPGMGRTIFEAVMSKDLPVLQGAFVLIVTLSVLASTAADFIYVWLNPVVRIVDGGK